MNPSNTASQDLIDSQEIIKNTEEDQGCLFHLKKRNYIKVKNYSKYDIYLKVVHYENERDYLQETQKGANGSFSGFKGSFGMGTKTESRSGHNPCFPRPPPPCSFPGVIRARHGEVCKKRRVYSSVEGSARTALSAFIKFNKTLDYRDVEEEEKGRLYLFEGFYCGPGYIRNIKTEHVNAAREEFREGAAAAAAAAAAASVSSKKRKRGGSKRKLRANDTISSSTSTTAVVSIPDIPPRATTLRTEPLILTGSSSLEADMEAVRVRYFSDLLGGHDPRPDVCESLVPDEDRRHSQGDSSDSDNDSGDDSDSGDCDVDVTCYDVTDEHASRGNMSGGNANASGCMSILGNGRVLSLRNRDVVR
jgi:hypothetical protein